MTDILRRDALADQARNAAPSSGQFGSSVYTWQQVQKALGPWAVDPIWPGCHRRPQKISLDPWRSLSKLRRSSSLTSVPPPRLLGLTGFLSILFLPSSQPTQAPLLCSTGTSIPPILSHPWHCPSQCSLTVVWGPLLTKLGCSPLGSQGQPFPVVSSLAAAHPLVTCTRLPAELRSPRAPPGWHLASVGAWLMVSGSLRWPRVPPSFF